MKTKMSHQGFRSASQSYRIKPKSRHGKIKLKHDAVFRNDNMVYQKENSKPTKCRQMYLPSSASQIQIRNFQSRAGTHSCARGQTFPVLPQNHIPLLFQDGYVDTQQFSYQRFEVNSLDNNNIHLYNPQHCRHGLQNK